MPTRSIEAELLHRRNQRFVSRSTPTMMSPTAGNASPRSPASPSTPTPAAAAYPTVSAGASGSGGLELAILTALDRGFRRVVLLLTPTAEETERRIAAFEALRNGLRRQDLHAYIFGSSRTGTVLPCSDLDVCVRRRELDHPCLQNPQRASDYILMPNSTLADLKGRLSGDGGGDSDDDESHNHHGRNTRNGGGNGGGGIRASQSLLSSGPRRRGMKVGSEFQDVLRYVNNRSAGFRNIFPITRSRVPIIKMVHGATGVPIDVTFTADGLLTSRLLYEEFYRVQVLFDRSLFKAGFARAEIPTRALIVLLKLVFSGAKMDDPAVGGIGSFVCSMLVLWYLRQALAKLEKQHGVESTSATSKGGAATPENPPTWWMKGRAGPPSSADGAAPGDKKKRLSGRRRDRDEDLAWDEGSAATPTPARARLPQLGLGALFAGLLRYYGSEFDAARTGVDCSRWMTFGKPPVAQLTLLNPIDPSTNAAAAASRYCRDAVPLIAQSYRSILAAAHTDAKRAADVGGASSPVAPASSAVVGTYAQVIRRVVPGLAERWPDPSALDSTAHREALRHAAGVDEAGFYYGLLL